MGEVAFPRQSLRPRERESRTGSDRFEAEPDAIVGGNDRTAIADDPPVDRNSPVRQPVLAAHARGFGEKFLQSPC